MDGDFTRVISNCSNEELLRILKKSTKISNSDFLILEMEQMHTSLGEKSKKEEISPNSNLFKIVLGIYTKEQDKIVFEKKKEVLLNDFEINSSLFDGKKYQRFMMQKCGKPQQYIENLAEYLKSNQVSNYDIFQKVDELIKSCVDVKPGKKSVKDEEEKPVESVYSTFLTMQNGIPFTKIS